ncbi:hypothetical protein [Spiroplasma endosymbiont of Amphimallon solstitiale]|uniref:hypothetical protein n=1 Tax=Spiroplasma endosymbiont of Amphimallon solstitiale TaxID=3066288 RepID=UPI00313E290F
MKIKTLKKLQLLTVLLFIFTILIMIIGLTIIGSCDYHSHIYNLLTKKYINLEKNFNYVEKYGWPKIIHQFTLKILFLIKNLLKVTLFSVKIL